MNQQDCIELSRRLLQRVQTDTSDLAAEAVSESAEVYTDPLRWQEERQKYFLNTPQVIGFAGEVAEKNSYLTAESMGIPIVVTRDGNNTLRAFINACAHRGAKVAEGCGSKKRLTCRFHGWSYALDGKLAGRPADSAFTPAGEECNLVELPVSDNAGLVVVGLNPAMEQGRVAHHLDDINTAFAGFAFDQLKQIETRKFAVAANWKLVVNLSHESYHFGTLHRDSLAPMMSAHAVIDEFGQHTRWAFPLRSITELENIEESSWPPHPPAAINHTVFPGTLVITNTSDAQIIRAEPGPQPGSSVVYYTGGYQHADRMEESRQAYEFGGSIFETEDLPAAEQCQQGIAAGQRPVMFGRNEPIVQIWQKKWSQGLG